MAPLFSATRLTNGNFAANALAGNEGKTSTHSFPILEDYFKCKPVDSDPAVSFLFLGHRMLLYINLLELKYNLSWLKYA